MKRIHGLCLSMLVVISSMSCGLKADLPILGGLAKAAAYLGRGVKSLWTVTPTECKVVTVGYAAICAWQATKTDRITQIKNWYKDPVHKICTWGLEKQWKYAGKIWSQQAEFQREFLGSHHANLLTVYTYNAESDLVNDGRDDRPLVIRAPNNAQILQAIKGEKKKIDMDMATLERDYLVYFRNLPPLLSWLIGERGVTRDYNNAWKNNFGIGNKSHQEWHDNQFDLVDSHMKKNASSFFNKWLLLGNINYGYAANVWWQLKMLRERLETIETIISKEYAGVAPIRQQYPNPGDGVGYLLPQAANPHADPA